MIRKRKTGWQGFSFIETLLVMAAIGTMALIALPKLSQLWERAKVTTARENVKSLQVALQRMSEDTQRHPGQSVDLLIGPGKRPEHDGDTDTIIWGVTGASTGSLADHLSQNNAGYTVWNPGQGVGWNGPYLHTIPEDPWGNQFWVGTQGFPDGSVIIISGGEDRTIDTAIDATAVSDSDIGTYLQ